MLCVGLAACTASPTAPAAAPAESGAPAPTVPTVARPWQPGMTELGVNVLWEDSKEDDDEVTRKKARRMIDYLVALHANNVALNFPYFMDGVAASTLRPDKLVPSPQRVAIFLQEAQAAALRVRLRPLLDERTLGEAWRGMIRPADRDRWFASYTSFLLPYAEVARDHGAVGIVLAVELNSLQGDRRWTDVIDKIKQVFPGELTYSVNFDDFQDRRPTPAVDRVGVDVYFKTDLPDSASVAELSAEWRSWLTRYAGRQPRGLVLDEVGIAAQDGGYRHPASWGNPKASLNLAVQASWYRAICDAVEASDIGGVYFWYVRMHHNPGHEDPEQADRLTFVDRPAEDAVRECFARLGP